jgi:hypothetical protein
LPIDFSGSGMGFFSVWWDGRFYWVLWWLDVVFGVVKMVNRMVEGGQEATIKFARAERTGNSADG